MAPAPQAWVLDSTNIPVGVNDKYGQPELQYEVLKRVNIRA